MTPNHFLIGRPGGDFAGKAVDDTCYDLQKCWKCTKELVKHVSRRWMQESLPRLNACHKCFKARRDFKVGVVMMLLTDLAHGKWQLGRILEMYPGKDGHVRVTNV